MSASPSVSGETWPEHVRGKLMLGVLRRIDRAEHELAQIAADHGRAVAAHHHDGMLAERARERGALLGLHHQQVGVAELVAAVPERRVRPIAAPRWNTGTSGTPEIANGMIEGA